MDIYTYAIINKKNPRQPNGYGDLSISTSEELSAEVIEVNHFVFNAQTVEQV